MIKTGLKYLVMLSLITVAACTSKEELAMRELDEAIRQTNRDVVQLGVHIDKGHIANTRKLIDYGNAVKVLMVDQPTELFTLIDTLTLDATSKGPIYTSLMARLADVKAHQSSLKGVPMIQKDLLELFAIQRASQIDSYGWMLTDPINVLADMSGGTLARVEAMSKEASLKANSAADFGAGSQLVGNPGYGEWKQDSSGHSFWHWYGQYAFFSSLFLRPIGYGSWSGQRDYSYYHSAGRYQYTAPNQQKAQKNIEQKAKRKFQTEGKKFVSPYDKRKTGSVGSTMQSRKVTKSFSSPYSASGKNTKSSKRLNSASSRNSSSSRSRSFGGGGK